MRVNNQLGHSIFNQMLTHTVRNNVFMYALQVELLGTENDWRALVAKLEDIK